MIHLYHQLLEQMVRLLNLSSNRLNNPIGLDNYAGDNRVDNSILDDPHAAIYISNTVNINKTCYIFKGYIISIIEMII